MKNIKNFKNYKFTIALAFLLSIILLSIIVYTNRYDWTPVNIPITKLDTNHKADFKADLWSTYFISIEFEPNRDIEY
jgi:hypothetical protein